MHYYLADLDQQDLVRRIRRASGNTEIVLWEMVGLNNIFTPVSAGPETAKALGIERGEVIGYYIPDGGGHFMGAAVGDAGVADPNQPPPMRDIVGTLRWRRQLSDARS